MNRQKIFIRAFIAVAFLTNIAYATSSMLDDIVSEETQKKFTSNIKLALQVAVSYTGLEEDSLFTILIGLALFLTLLGTFEQLTFLAVGVIYPAFKSFEALESIGNGNDDKEWLTYWVCFAGFIMFDQLAGRILLKRIVPFYFFIKMIFLVYLFHPRTKGARYMYELVMQPLLKGNHAEIIQMRDEVQEQIQNLING